MPVSACTRPSVALAAFACGTAILAAAVVPPGRVSAQTRFRAGVDMVEADAVVLDGAGRPVPGLTIADFTLSVDGQARPIESVDYVDAGGAGVQGGTEAANPAGGAPKRRADRHVIFVIDEGNISAGGGKAAVASAQRMLDRLGPADRIALLTLPTGPAVEFTTEHAPVRAALNRSVGRAARPTGADDFDLSLVEVFAFDIGATVDERALQQKILIRECPLAMPPGRRELCVDSLRAEAQARLESYRERARATVGGLDKLFRALSKMQGPKIVVLVSEGLLLRPDLRDASVTSQLAKLAAASRVTLYSVLLESPLVDAGAALGRERSGLPTSTAAQDRAIEEDGLKALTSESGGLLFRAPAAPDDAFRRLADALSGYYLVTFRATPADTDGPHTIALKTTRQALTVHARAQFVMTAPALRAALAPGAATGTGPSAVPRPAAAPRRSDAASAFSIDKVAVQVATRSIADANGKIRILLSLDVRDPAAHETSALALGYKLRVGDRIVTDSGRVVPVTRGPDGIAQPISYIAFQGLAPGTYELQLSASDGSKHSAFVTHTVSARLHAIGGYTLSDLLLAASAQSADGPFPVPARPVAADQIVTGVEVTAGDRAALANTTVRFEVVPAGSRETVASQDVMLSPAGPLGQFVRATLDLAAASPGEYIARASIVAAGASLGVVDAPFQLAK
jgi:VWFA-related protein